MARKTREWIDQHGTVQDRKDQAKRDGKSDYKLGAAACPLCGAHDGWTGCKCTPASVAAAGPHRC